MLFEKFEKAPAEPVGPAATNQCGGTAASLVDDQSHTLNHLCHFQSFAK